VTETSHTTLSKKDSMTKLFGESTYWSGGEYVAGALLARVSMVLDKVGHSAGFTTAGGENKSGNVMDSRTYCRVQVKQMGYWHIAQILAQARAGMHASLSERDMRVLEWWFAWLAETMRNVPDLNLEGRPGVPGSCFSRQAASAALLAAAQRRETCAPAPAVSHSCIQGPHRDPMERFKWWRFAMRALYYARSRVFQPVMLIGLAHNEDKMACAKEVRYSSAAILTATPLLAAILTATPLLRPTGAGSWHRPG
jgi:hypothetical protein